MGYSNKLNMQSHVLRVITMYTFFEFLKEILKGIVRASSAHLFQKTFLNKEKTTRRRDKQKGGSRKK